MKQRRGTEIDETYIDPQDSDHIERSHDDSNTGSTHSMVRLTCINCCVLRGDRGPIRGDTRQPVQV